jgi:hypothetical protein
MFEEGRRLALDAIVGWLGSEDATDLSAAS